MKFSSAETATMSKYKMTAQGKRVVGSVRHGRGGVPCTLGFGSIFEGPPTLVAGGKQEGSVLHNTQHPRAPPPLFATRQAPGAAKAHSALTESPPGLSKAVVSAARVFTTRVLAGPNGFLLVCAMARRTHHDSICQRPWSRQGHSSNTF